MSATHVDVREAYRLQAGKACADIDVRAIPEHEGGYPLGTVKQPVEESHSV